MDIVEPKTKPQSLYENLIFTFQFAFPAYLHPDDFEKLLAKLADPPMTSRSYSHIYEPLIEKEQFDEHCVSVSPITALLDMDSPPAIIDNVPGITFMVACDVAGRNLADKVGREAPGTAEDAKRIFLEYSANPYQSMQELFFSKTRPIPWIVAVDEELFQPTQFQQIHDALKLLEYEVSPYYEKMKFKAFIQAVRDLDVGIG